MNILILCACLFGLFVVQVCSVLLLLRYIQAKIYAIKDSVYEDIAAVFKDLFVPSKEGEQSKIGVMMSVLASQLADQFADQLFTKLKMSAIGQKGGSAPRQGGAGGLGGLLPMLIDRFLPGGIAGLVGGLGNLGGPSDGAPQQPNGNHSDNAPKFKF